MVVLVAEVVLVAVRVHGAGDGYESDGDRITSVMIANG